jgi:hypothetical protein
MGGPAGASPGYEPTLVAITGSPHPLLRRLTAATLSRGLILPSNPIPSPAPQSG